MHGLPIYTSELQIPSSSFTSFSTYSHRHHLQLNLASGTSPCLAWYSRSLNWRNLSWTICLTSARQPSYHSHAPARPWRNKRFTLYGQTVQLHCWILSTESCHMTYLPLVHRDHRYVISWLYSIWLVSDLRRCQQPTETEWNRLRRRASWMRELHFYSGHWQDDTVPDEILDVISASLPSGFICPQLRIVSWSSSTHRVFNRIFVSSHLTKFKFSCRQSNIEVLVGLASVMAELQAPFLQSLVIITPIPEDPILTNLKTALSSAILRCGPSLTNIIISVPLTGAAVRHAMQLPELTTWGTGGAPPDVLDLSPLDTSPKLECIHLHTVEALRWLPFFKENARRPPSDRVTHSQRNRGPHQTLTTIECQAPSRVDAALMSSLMLFRGLRYLHLEPICSRAGGCGFDFTDDGVGEMVTALPNLYGLNLGDVCSADSCKTTVASLLITSACCKDLEYLRIHFRTRDLLHDLESMPNNPRLRNLLQLPRCRLGQLDVSKAPLEMEEGYERVAEVFLRIFPSIRGVSGKDPGWDMISKVISKKLED